MAPTVPPALEIRGLTKHYDDGTVALSDFDLTIPEGKFFGLLGPNGAGKTTLISAVCNLIRITGAGSASPSRTSTSTASSPSRRRSSTTAATSACRRTMRAPARAR